MAYGGATTVKIFYQRRRKTTAGNNIATIIDDDIAEAHALGLGLDVDVTAVTPSDPPRTWKALLILRLRPSQDFRGHYY